MAETVNYRKATVALTGSELTESGLTPHGQKAIFFASFMTLIAAGIGFAVRGGILGDWGAQFGFTKSDLGVINGAGLAGFGITIIFFSFFADAIGYRALLLLAFLLFAASGVVTLIVSPIFRASGQNAAYYTLYIGTFIFSVAQGLCEAAINPLTATLFPRRKTHYLNILHAGWPGGLMLGGLINYLFASKTAQLFHVRWEILASLYLIPTLYFGSVVLKQKFPISEAKRAGVSFGQMLATLAAPILLVIFLAHAMVGYVELGTDSWIQNILRNTLFNTASLLFAYTSILMFILRFFAGPIVHKINPLGLLFLAACCGASGLFFLGSNSTGILIWVAATVFAMGKSFYWPTLLGVVGERFPKGGALAMGFSGGIGMLSAGFLGGPGIGYTYDRYASQHLEQTSPETFVRVVSPEEKHFLTFAPVKGLDGAKVDVIKDTPPGAQLAADMDTLAKSGKTDPNLTKLNDWFQNDEKAYAQDDQPVVKDADIYGGREALKITAGIPVGMAAIFLLLVIYFAMRGGYKAVHLDASGREIEVSHDAKEEIAIEAMGTEQA
jgi:MFS family permease